jgi:phosphoribosylamine--glycine ligase
LKVLIVGGGGREHAIAWKLAQSPRVTKLFCAPGNGGIADLAQCVAVEAEDIPGLTALVSREGIDFVVVGPELPLTLGITEAIGALGVPVFGPSKAAAQLEGSKAYAKALMIRCGAPTARYGVFEEVQAAKAYAEAMEGPWVIKADGLAAGKGVVICNALDEAHQAIRAVLEEKVFGEAGAKLVIEEFLEGEELSVMAFCDGKTMALMASAQDHKRVFDQDQGPNTGGMGAYSPATAAGPELLEDVRQRILLPVMNAMNQEGRMFKGVMYAGLMLTQKGPMVLEFNVRFGDPETQAVLPRLENDLMDILEAVTQTTLDQITLSWRRDYCVSVVMASQGYPGQYRKGDVIHGLDALPDRVWAFHSGTSKGPDGLTTTNGGRVLAVTGLGGSLREAVETVYEGVGRVHFEGAHYRKDIGSRGMRGAMAEGISQWTGPYGGL